MQLCGLSAADFAAYVAQLRDSYAMSIVVDLLDMDGNPVVSLSPYVLDGQVDVDATRDPIDPAATADQIAPPKPVRTLSLTLLDPDQTLGFDSASASDTAVFLDNMIQVFHRIYVPALSRHVDCPLFYGPVRSFARSGVEVTLTAVGLEDLASGDLWDPLTINKGVLTTDAIRTILGRAGETRFSIPDLPDRLPAVLSLGRAAKPWAEASQLADGLNRQLFYDATGRLILRDYPAKPLFTIRQGDQPTGETSDILDDVQVGISLTDGWFNLVEVLGAVTGKTRIRAVCVAPPESQLAPASLGHNGAPYYAVNSVENTSLRTVQQATDYGNRLLDDQLRQVVDVTAGIKAFPFLEENDLVQLQTRSGFVQFRLTKFTIPLAASTSMSIGYQKLTTLNRLPRP